jgi:hypothetical protein
MVAKFTIFSGAEVGSWGLKYLGNRIEFFMASLEVNEGKINDLASMPVTDPIIGMNLSLSQMELVQS